MSTPATPTPHPFAMQSRIMAGAWMGALVMIAAIAWFVLGSTDEPFNVSLVLAGVVLVAGFGMHRVVEQVGYAVAPLPTSDTDATNAEVARKVWTARMVVRFALCEAIALIALAGGFVVEQGGLALALLGIAVSLALMAVHAWPGARPVNRMAAGLEAGGARSGLREAFGVAAV